ncbi:MAG: PhoH family protein [Planctomycetaceae bacterium]
MSETTIRFEDHEKIQTLFGARDENLRRVRDTLGVDVVVRGDELRLHGEDAQIRRGRKVIEELRSIIEQQGTLHESELTRVLGHAADENNVSHDENLDIAESFSSVPNIQPRSAGQAYYLDSINKNELVFCAGPAGCGKTYLAVAMAVNALRTEQVRKIVLVRPAVEAGEKLGFLPGDLFAKVNPYLRPLLDALNDILSFETVATYLEKDVIEIVPLAFMRGRTLNNTFIILDEAQNTTVTQMKMFLTRMGHNSRIVVTGDTTQVDLPPHMKSGLTDSMSRLSKIEGVGMVNLTGKDIVRHRLVREVVNAYERGPEA